MRTLGVGIFDGASIIMSRVNLTVEKHEGEGFVHVAMNESRYVDAIRLFVTKNYALLSTVERFATEKQIKPEMISLELAILAYLKATFPHAEVLRVSALSTRAFFNTSLKNDAISEENAYLCRKEMSVEVLNNIFERDTIT